MMLRRSCTWNLKPSGKFMNVEVEDPNGIFHVKDDGHRVDWLERHHSILRNAIMRYISCH